MLDKDSTTKLDPTTLSQGLKNKLETLIISMKGVLVVFLLAGKIP